MKLKIITSLIFLSMCFVPATQAQFWKKLKKKAQEKISKAEDELIDKLDKKTDKKIDETIDGKKEEEKSPKNKTEKDYGDATVNHSNTYGSLKIEHLSRTTVEKIGNNFKILGYWFSHDVDVFDGYSINLKNTSIEELEQGKTFRIPNEAELNIGYDPLLGERKNRKDLWKGSFENKAESGTLTVKFIKDNSVSISYSANGKLSNYIETNSQTDEGYYDKKPMTINGSITTTDPKYIITKPEKIKKKTSESNSKLTENDKTYITEKLSPTVNIPSSFSFDKSIELEFTNERGESYPMEFLLGKYPDIWGMSVASKEMQGQGQVLVVTTPKSSTTFMDVAGMKMKKSTSLEEMGDNYNMTDKLPEDGDFEYKKTGNTKTILGYTCEEYKVDYNYTNSKGSASFWVSKEFPIQNIEMPMLGMKMNNPYLDGFVLELNSTHQGQNWVIQVTKVSDKNININTSAYKKMGF